MTVQITVNSLSDSIGPFNLYSNTDGYVIPFETGVTLGALLSGFVTTNPPEYTTIVRVQSTGTCNNYVDVILSTSLFG